MLSDKDIEKILKSNSEANDDIISRHDASIIVTYDFIKGDEHPEIHFNGPTIVLDGLMMLLNTVYEYEPCEGEVNE